MVLEPFMNTKKEWASRLGVQAPKKAKPQRDIPALQWE